MKIPPAPIASRISDHWPYVRELADRMSQEKRLTDAELAAEWQAFKRNEAIWVITANPRATEAIRRLRTIERFATLPHNDEAAL